MSFDRSDLRRNDEMLSRHNSEANAKRQRFGLLPATVGAMFAIKLESQIADANGRPLPKGKIVHISVKAAWQEEEASAIAKWRCLNPECAAHRWDTKRELIAAHPPNGKLIHDEEVHCYMAVAYMPGTKARGAKLDADGFELEPAVFAQHPRVLILSDEEG